MPFLNPRADFASSVSLVPESDTSKLISLLNAVLQVEGDKRIAEIEILNPYNAPKISLLKDSYLDIRARDASGKYYLIEMQVANVQGMQKRALYNACKQYSNQLNQGDDYLLLNDVNRHHLHQLRAFRAQKPIYVVALCSAMPLAIFIATTWSWFLSSCLSSKLAKTSYSSYVVTSTNGCTF